MNFIEAINALMEGKKVRRLFWDRERYIMVDKYGNIIDNDGKPYEIEYLADNWEIFQ